MFSFVQIISAILSFIAIFDWPYDYYTLLRFVVCPLAAYTAFQFRIYNKNSWVWIFGIVAVMFNPIIRIHLEKTTWQIINIVVGALILVSIFLLQKEKKSKK